MLRQGNLPCTAQTFMETLAEHTDSEDRNLLHDAVQVISADCVIGGGSHDSTKYFLGLLRLGFPLYGED